MLTFWVVVFTVVCFPFITCVIWEEEVAFEPKLPVLIEWNTFDISGIGGNKSLFPIKYKIW